MILAISPTSKSFVAYLTCMTQTHAHTHLLYFIFVKPQDLTLASELHPGLGQHSKLDRYVWSKTRPPQDHNNIEINKGENK